MKILFLLIVFILTVGSGGAALSADRRIIENQGIGVFTTQGARVALALQNDNCVGNYRVASGKTIIGEGTIDFRLRPVTSVPFGERDLRISCIAENRLIVVIR